MCARVLYPNGYRFSAEEVKEYKKSKEKKSVYKVKKRKAIAKGAI